MKLNFGNYLILVLLTAFLATSSASPTSAQTSDPPVIMENSEILQDFYVDDQVMAERRLTAVDGGVNGITTTYSYWSISGYAFVPAASYIRYTYVGYGCVDTEDYGDSWIGSVNLPHGSTIVRLYFNYYNEVDDPTDTNITLKRYSYYGTFDDILYTAGYDTGIGNHSTSTSTVTNAVVDNLNYSYVLIWSGKEQQRLCGVNIIYTPPPIFFNALPLINR